MDVYIEYVILDNLTIDVMLLWLAAITLKLPYKWWRIALGGVVGALCAVLSVFINGWIIYVVKTVCVIVMCVTACGIGKKLLWYILLVTAYTFVLGGAIIAVFHFFKVDYITENGEFYSLNVPLFVYVLAAFLTVLLCYFVAFYVRQARRAAPYIVKATVSLNEKDISVCAFCDSGNTLTHNDAPVCFVTRKFDGFANYFAEQALRGKVEKIEVTTVVGTQYVAAVKAQICACGKEMQAYLALPCDKCTTPYNLILSAAFLDETTASASGIIT